MQARRRAQPSGTNSPSSSHPRLKHRARCVIFIRARHAAARVAPVKGYLAGSNTEEPRGSAPRERDHRGGDHPVPSRTRQLSPPSPRVLQRKAAGGQGVALAEGAFLFAPIRPAGGSSPCGPVCVRGMPRPRAPHAPKARRGSSPCGPSRVLMGFGPPSPSREERWRDCSEVFLASPCAFSCAGAGFGRAACGGRIRCTRPARLGTRRKARACAGSYGPFRVFGRGLRLVGVPVCAALRGAPESPQRGHSCGLFRVIGEGSPHTSSHALCAEMTLSNKHIILHAVACGMTIAPVVSGLFLSLGIFGSYSRSISRESWSSRSVA